MSDLATYESGAQPARARLAGSRWVTEILVPGTGVPGTDPELLELFLIHFCSLGVLMTEPAEGWIRRAGERCAAVGLEELGAALIKHSKQEAGHHLLMINDTRALVARRRLQGRTLLDSEALLSRAPTPGIQRYIKLHEDVIAGPAPFAQIAIEFEIERMSMIYGPRFIERCQERLGPDIKNCLSFVEDHAALDVGHTKFNAAQLSRLLEARPEFLPDLVLAGAEALDAYSAFFTDCIALAQH